ncbi:GMC family oxidoreductase N-terminal domain-containing protein [Actinoplanes sp. NPDC049596]|uniref:GMC family oxidoreductase N-terminal domain-containing protein n=1 Tax=unclassified Actinoplanes TaxID=2626549 RepID=UPI00343211F4
MVTHSSRIRAEGWKSGSAGSTRCTGVTYAARGVEVTVRTNREVILAAGAIGSAQLLLVSGIGPANDLDTAGVPVIHDLPGVGTGLQSPSADPEMASPARHGPRRVAAGHGVIRTIVCRT